MIMIGSSLLQEHLLFLHQMEVNQNLLQWVQEAAHWEDLLPLLRLQGFQCLNQRAILLQDQLGVIQLLDLPFLALSIVLTQINQALF